MNMKISSTARPAILVKRNNEPWMEPNEIENTIWVLQKEKFHYYFLFYLTSKISVAKADERQYRLRNNIKEK